MIANHKENMTKSLNWWLSNSEKADTQFSEPRVHRSQGTLNSKGGGKLSIHFCADGDTIEPFFRTIISANQLSIYGAVSDLCDEIQCVSCKNGETCTGRTIWSIVWASKVVDDNTYTFDWSSCTRRLLQKYKERVERLSQQNRVIKICTDAGFLTTVDVGQYFIHDKRHCRILTIYRVSGLLWVHFAKRRRFNWTKRLDSREHQNGTRIGSHNQLPAR